MRQPKGCKDGNGKDKGKDIGNDKVCSSLWRTRAKVNGKGGKGGKLVPDKGNKKAWVYYCLGFKFKCNRRGRRRWWTGSSRCWNRRQRSRRRM